MACSPAGRDRAGAAMPLLEARELTMRFGGVVAVNGVSFALEAGEIVGLIGPNGAGKTTCFNLLSGFLPPTAGRVLFDGDDVTRWAPHHIARRGFVRTFQKQSLFGGLRVVENVMIGQQAVLRPSVARALLRRGSQDAETAAVRRRALEILEFLGMGERAEARAGDLAYGDQRRLAVGIALAARPTLLALDEPAAGLNPSESDALRRLIARVRDDGVSVLLVEHDMAVVMNLCDRVVVLDSGRKIADGKPEAIRADPEVIRVYLGEAYAAGGRGSGRA